MYVVTGITGQVGGAVAQALLGAGLPVRAVVRNAEKGAAWAARGCEIAVADVLDPEALKGAFADAEAVFLMMPPNYDPEPGFPQTMEIAAAVMSAIEVARPGRLVFLSTVGAHVEEPMLLNNSRLMEEALRRTPIPVCSLRAAWFMENASWDVGAAREGVVPSFLQPLDHAIPMVATADIGQTAASLLQEDWTGVRVVELEGPERYSANDIASAFSSALGHPVEMKPVPRDSWEALFRSQGMANPMPRIRMLDGFNEGWIDFERKGTEHRIGTVRLDGVIKALVAR
ncbi:putative nucleoside-diphosphate-sugar epimerase [Sphingobium indicum BiD32]|uniref:Nucleoside-diphosphate-sugar epimerase n=1 Tax=Sphingobium indicum BiD32 TaxID=1301087 RepID=N1MQP0_9SPHN|nr:NmrA family NAD(P)-binding protein [Sphingobium indicum]CCW19064.1 putative nucleoside-diphosphate-sugar epimerase [Sphingobium indicum BiD32]